MGSRRLGVQRLNALLKAGSTQTDSSYQAGDGIVAAIKSHKMIKRGGLVYTQIFVDLQTDGSGKGGTAVWGPSTDRDVIGTGTACDTTTAVNASLMLWEDDVHGAFRSVTMHCLEVPAGGANAILDIALIADTGINTLSDASGVADDNIKDLCNPKGNWAAGKAIGNGPDGSNDHDGVITVGTAVPDGDRIYLVSGANKAGVATNYTSGKFLIEFIGAEVQGF